MRPWEFGSWSGGEAARVTWRPYRALQGPRQRLDEEGPGGEPAKALTSPVSLIIYREVGLKELSSVHTAWRKLRSFL